MNSGCSITRGSVHTRTLKFDLLTTYFIYLPVSYHSVNMTTFRDRESAMENSYFNREEARLLQKMMSKIKKNVDDKEGAHVEAHDDKALKDILGSAATPELIHKLMDWKYHCHDETH